MTVTGEGFAPVPARVLTEPVLTLPTLQLARVGGLDGIEEGAVESVITLTT